MTTTLITGGTVVSATGRGEADVMEIGRLMTGGAAVAAGAAR